MLWLSHAEREHELWSELWTFGVNAPDVCDRRAAEPVLGARPAPGRAASEPQPAPVFTAAAQHRGAHRRDQ